MSRHFISGRVGKKTDCSWYIVGADEDHHMARASIILARGTSEHCFWNQNHLEDRAGVVLSFESYAPAEENGVRTYTIESNCEKKLVHIGLLDRSII